MSDQDILFPLSSKIALVGRFEGDEDMVELDRESVAKFNATVMGYAMKQIYAPNDRFCYTRPAPQALGNGSTLLQDPHLKVRQEGAALSKLVDDLSDLTVTESTDLAKMLREKWRLTSSNAGPAGA